MRHVLAFLAGACGLGFGLLLAWVVFGVALGRPDLLASRVVVLVALLPALVGHAVVDRGGRHIEQLRRSRGRLA